MHANAHARARAELVAAWTARIAAGATERGAATGLAPVATLRSWARRQPELGALLATAHATKVERIERELRRIALGQVTDPRLARAQVAACRWLLSKWDRETYGDGRAVEVATAAMRSR